MHILIVHQAFATLHEPGGTRHHEFARLLAGRGHRVTIIASPVSYLTGSPAASASEEREDGVRVLRARVYAAHHRSFFHRLIAFFSFMISSLLLGLRVEDVDLVWGTSPPIFQGVTAWALARVKCAPFLFEVRDLWPQFAIAVGVLRHPILIRLSEWLERFLYRHAERVVVNSPGFVAHVQDRGARQVELIPNGADPEMFNPLEDGAAFRRAHGWGNAFIVLYAGAHGVSNDLAVVLEAAERLAHRKDIRFVLLGDGKEKPSLQARAREKGLDNVTFLPPVPKNEVPLALAAADACLAILKPLEEYKTTYPNKVFDYMAAGRPIVLAIDGVIREVVEAAGCGIFARPGSPSALAEAVLFLESNREQARKMGTAGRKYLEENFSRQALVERLITLLEGMAKATSCNG